MQIGEAFVAVRPDTRGFGDQLTNEVEGAGRQASARLGQVVTAGLLAGGVAAATQGAAQLEQAVGATETVFGDASAAIDEYAETAAEAMGLSERKFRENTSSIGALLTNMGYANDEAADWSIQLTQLGADLAAAFGGRPEDAVHALGRALVGEFDPLEQFNVSIRQAEINQKAVEMGLAATTSEVDKNARAQAALALIMEQTAGIQGQFARETDTAAGAAAIAAAETENAADSLGENFLPVYKEISELVGTVASGFGSLPGPVQTGVVALAGAAVLAGPAKTGVELLGSATSALRSGLDRAADAAPRAWQGLQRVGSVSGTSVAGVAGLTAAIATLVIAAQKIEEQEADKAQDRLSVSSDRLAESLANTAASGELLGSLGEDVDRYAEALGTLDESWFERASREWIGPFGTDSADQAAMDAAIEDFEQLDSALIDLQRTDPEAAAAAFTTLGEALVAQGFTWGEVGAAVPGYVAAVNDAEEANAAGVGATEDATDANEDLAEETESVKDRYEEAAAAVRDAKAALDEYFDRVTSGLDASLDWEEAVDDLTDAWMENQGSLDENTEAGRNNWRSLQDVADAAIGAGQAILDAGGEAADAKAKTNELAAALRDQLIRDLGLSGERADYVLRTLGLMPDQVETAYNLSGIDKALSDIQKLKLELSGITNIGGLVAGNIGFAEGTDYVPADGAYLVGERGPEIVNLGRGDTVTPNHELPGAAGGVRLVQNFYGNVTRSDIDRANRRALFALTTLSGG